MNRFLVVTLSAMLLAHCSVRRLAVDQVANALAAGGTTFSADDDPELVGAALPFSLKLMESLLAETPRNRSLLVASARAFTQYSYGWVAPVEGDTSEDAIARRERANRLYLRGRDYGMRALETSIDNFRVRFASNPEKAMRLARKEDIDALYWTAASWALAIGGSTDDLELLGDLRSVEALITRAAELDPGYGDGAIDTFLLSFEAARAGVSRDAAARAREHFRHATERSGGMAAAPLVAAAESLSIPARDRTEFESLLNRALAIDPGARPAWRLENILAQRRARWLLDHAGDYFDEQSTEE